MRTLGSAFNDAVSSWGYSGATNAVQFSARAAFPLGRLFSLGVRAGYVYAPGGKASADGQVLDSHILDLGVVLRASHEWQGLGDSTIGIVGIDLEAGPVLGSVLLRGRSDLFGSVRVGGTGFVGFAPRVRSVAFLARLGYHYVPYGGAGVGAFDPVYSGFDFGLGIEVPL